ncbi:energy transducer TonB [uncultured Psychroserpens sp.]|uniref:energy transducer TonB n=1 Tax=uncultured Psychroserpens sp. TaxID=255436 RepID=UPI002602AEEC|nr:energy transducer TonB [uncultured Psychroserpens sp.]
MEPKKNSKAEIGRNSSLYFSVGLLLVMSLTYMTLNFKTYDKEVIDIGRLDLEALDDEEIPITNQDVIPPPPPPPPPVVPEEIEIVEDEKEIEETVIESTETDQEEEIVEVEEVEVEEVEEDIEVPFHIIENVPVFPGCEKKKTNEKKRQCMSDKINRFIKKKFNLDLANELGLQAGKYRISMMFIVDEKGNITNIQARGPDTRLDKEAKRVLRLLPKMEPGKQRGRAVRVPYAFPLTFQVDN